MDEFLDELDDDWDDPEGLFDDPFESDEEFGVEPTYETARAVRRKEVPTVGSTPKSSRKKKLNGQGNQKSINGIPALAGQDALSALARSIQLHEGWVSPSPGQPRGSSSYRNLNPGNLKFVGQRGAVGADERGFAIFGSYNAGWSALLRDLGAKISRNPNHTILSLIQEYEGGDPENPAGNDLAYAQSVAASLRQHLGKTVTINTKINGL